MSSIVTNVGALNAQRNLGITGMKMGKVLEKLSSGYRINRAADDAAGLGISEKMRAQIRGNSQAIRNAQDGISMIQTAEGAMDEVHSILQRMRELGVQAANDTYDTAARDSIATELDQLRTEIDRIANGTQFNGQNLLTGNLGSTPASVTGGNIGAGDVTAQAVFAGTGLGANINTGTALGAASVASVAFSGGAPGTVAAGKIQAGTTGAISVDGSNIASFTYGGKTYTSTNAIVANAQTLTFTTGTGNDTESFDVAITGTETIANIAAALTGKTFTFGESSSAVATVQQIQTSATTLGGTYTLSAVSNNPTQLSVSDGTNTYLVTVGPLSAGSNTLTLGGTGLTLTLAAAGGVSAEAVVADLTKTGQNQIVVTGASGGAVLQVGANVSLYDQMSISFNDTRASTAGGLNLANQNVTAVQAAALSATVAVDFSQVSGSNGIVGSNDRAQAFVYIVDQAITTLNSRRANLGASQNRLEHTVNSLGVAVENLTASESRIRDADVAQLSSQMVSNQILQQAGTAVLSQANQAPQSVLSLLRGS